MSEEGASGMSAAQLRAKKRQDKIRASAGTRLGKLTTSARGEEADYIKKDTPFDRPPQVTRSLSTADPDDIDLSLTPSGQQKDPVSSFAASDAPDLMSLFGGMGQDGANQIPPELANHPLFSMLQNMTGGQGNPFLGGQQQQPEQVIPAREKTLFERLLPLLHMCSMVALVSWAVWNSQSSIHWQTLATRRSLKDYVVQAVGIARPAPLMYAFITTQLVLQTLHVTIARKAPPPPSLLSSILPMIPHPFGLWIGASIKYYALAGQILDDLSIVIVALGLVIVWHSYMYPDVVPVP